MVASDERRHRRWPRQDRAAAARSCWPSAATARGGSSARPSRRPTSRRSAPSRSSSTSRTSTTSPTRSPGADAVVFAAGAGPGSGPARKRTVDYGGAVKLVEAARPGHPPLRDRQLDRRRTIRRAGRSRCAPTRRRRRRPTRTCVESGLDYTIIRPGGLTDDPGTGKVAGRRGARLRAGDARRRRRRDRRVPRRRQHDRQGVRPAQRRHADPRGARARSRRRPGRALGSVWPSSGQCAADPCPIRTPSPGSIASSARATRPSSSRSSCRPLSWSRPAPSRCSASTTRSPSDDFLKILAVTLGLTAIGDRLRAGPGAEAAAPAEGLARRRPLLRADGGGLARWR